MNKIDVVGVPVTLEEIQQARQKLATTGGTAIKQVLRAKDVQSPLASCDYWGEIKAALAAHPELKVASQTKSNHAPKAKAVFDFVLASKEATLAGDGQVAPDAADNAYTPPSEGGEVPKNLVFETDPDKVDRGTKAHKNTQNALAGALRKRGVPETTARLAAEVPETVASAVHRRTEGNPFFTQEVLQTLVERGHVYRQDAQWEWRDSDDIELPATVRLVLDVGSG